ncbi:hypothetical protein SCHPADRAFT_586620 [Schizopora paradoxa]|uniref:Uncharacterized protein n=1 Tax=Schizopora paradoxa TaxID=27342 RepID=A0A0H2RC03_9AGAM|nr:hypothetical protein SCHPADRAFT_586620 [Schizopora paradoxa]
MKSKTVDTGITIAVRLLELINESSDMLPPLKTAASGVLSIVRLVEGFRSNKKEWAQFLQHVQKSVALVAQSAANQVKPDALPSPSTTTTATDYVHSLEELNRCVSTNFHALLYTLFSSGCLSRFKPRLNLCNAKAVQSDL